MRFIIFITDLNFNNFLVNVNEGMNYWINQRINSSNKIITRQGKDKLLNKSKNEFITHDKKMNTKLLWMKKINDW